MKEFGLKVCFFLFLVAVLSGRTNELGTLTGAIAGTILFWPIYRRHTGLPSAKPRPKVIPDEEPAQVSAE
jgi:ABC-type branched-subunit amino acid transport system permease subunit